MAQKLLRYAKISLKSLRARSVRSWITIIGIVVSIAVILTLLTLSAGLQTAVYDLFQKFGTNRIIVMSADDTGLGLAPSSITTTTVKEIAGLPQFSIVIPRLILAAQQVEYHGKSRFITVAGLDSNQANDIYKQYNINDSLREGQFFSRGARGVAVIGGQVANAKSGTGIDVVAWTKPILLQNSILIGGEQFKVIGIFKDDSEFGNDIIIPLDDARALSNKTIDVTSIDAIVKDNVPMADAQVRLERLLNQTLGKDNYVVITPDGILRQFTQVIGIVQAVLIAIASVSLLVGAVGILNTMFTSVLEREKEIGIMKSIGSTNSDIMTLFLMESGFIGLFGGVAGVILGIGISYLVGAIATSMGFPLLVINISMVYVIGCLLFSFGIGMASGVIPSYRAARKKIIDTLRDA